MRRYESGGDFLWPYLIFFTMISLVIGQATMISYMTLMGGLSQVPLLIPLPFVTYAHYRRVASKYVEPAKFLHREAVADHKLFTSLAHHLDPNYYKQPVLTVDAAHPASAAFVEHRNSLRPHSLHSDSTKRDSAFQDNNPLTQNDPTPRTKRLARFHVERDANLKDKTRAPDPSPDEYV